MVWVPLKLILCRIAIECYVSADVVIPRSAASTYSRLVYPAVCLAHTGPVTAPAENFVYSLVFRIDFFLSICH